MAFFSFGTDKVTGIIKRMEACQTNVDLISVFVGTCPGVDFSQIFRSMMYCG